jgi:hypothetical protein
VCQGSSNKEAGNKKLLLMFAWLIYSSTLKMEAVLPLRNIGGLLPAYTAAQFKKIRSLKLAIAKPRVVFV